MRTKRLVRTKRLMGCNGPFFLRLGDMCCDPGHLRAADRDRDDKTLREMQGILAFEQGVQMREHRSECREDL